MDTTNNMQNRPQLRKVKRPINRMPQTAPVSSAQPQTAPTSQAQSQVPPQINSNPFIQQTQSQTAAPEAEDAFNLDAYLDESRLPVSNAKTPSRNDNPQFLQEEDLLPEYPAQETELPPYLTKKILILLGAVLFFLGIICAKLLLSDSKVVRNGLQGVVVNAEVPKGRARCGVAERTQGCVLYIMNPQRQELNARDFYDLAAQMTGRQRFVIETGNMRYANTKIRPGDIAQLNIPPL